ncbi:MAG: gamma-glutamyl-gamma-aminobutyrate hydrolase family protein [Acidimicrobiales bacterium]
MTNGQSADTRGASAKPLIGLSGRRKSAKDVAGFPDSLSGLEIDLYIADYARAVLAAGGLPVHLPMDADPTDYLGQIHGVLLSGGADIAPEMYGQEPDGQGGYEPERDALELTLLAGAIDQDLPVLGICRGLQMINVHAGGTLHQHVPEHARYDVAPHAKTHEVTFESETRLSLLYGGSTDSSPSARMVNSLHHQTIDELGHGLKVSARGDDGVIEGLELPGQDLLAVQWHPEMLLEPEPVFDWLISQANKRLNA